MSNKTWFLILCLLLLSGRVLSQKVGNDIFLKGNTVEIGMSRYGCYGTAGEPPTNYHPRSGEVDNRLGFVADPAGDGWTVGSPNYLGDYFIPAAPHEGWDMMIGSTWNRAWGSYTGGSYSSAGGDLILSGNAKTYEIIGRKKVATWTGKMGDLDIFQKTSLDTTKTFFIIDVMLVNTSKTTPVNNIYYERTVDPDNEATITSDFETNNQIVYQPTLSTGNKCLVTALGKEFPSLSYLGLGTVDCRAKVYILNSGNLTPTTNLSNIYNGLSTYHMEPGEQLISDCGIGLIFHLGNLGPGDTTTFAYAYILKESDLDSAFYSLTPKWEINGHVYFNNDTIRACVGDELNAEIIDAGNYTWSNWLPTIGLSHTSGTFNHIIVDSTLHTYNVVGLSPNCDNDTMKITISPYVHTIDTFQIVKCHGESYFFNGASRTESGFYKDTVLSSKGCDSLVTLHLTIKPPATDTIYGEICPLGTYYFDGVMLNTEGMYEAATMIDGCLGIQTLFLDIVDTLKKSDTVLMCEGDTLLLDGHTITTAGVYPTPFVTSVGCDSIHTFYVFEKPVHHTHDSIWLCQNDLPYNFYGLYIPEGTVSTANFGTATLNSSLDCDSFVLLDVFIIDTSRTDIDTNICFGMTFEYGPHNISETGTYLRYYTNSKACDSVVALTVFYLEEPIRIDSNYYACDSMGYKGKSYTQSTILYDTFYNYLNCDSVYKKVKIEIAQTVYDTTQIDICVGESYLFGDLTIETDTTITQNFPGNNGCDSVSTLSLTVHPLPEVKLFYESENEWICILDSIQITGKGATEYDFYDIFDRLLSIDNPSKVLVPNLENVFYVVGTDKFGCQNADTIQIMAQSCCELVVPNAFSPNGDGVNDQFKAISYGHPQNYRMEIYNRWGDLVFVAYDVNDAWDGQDQKGKPAQTGTYFYMITGNCHDSSPILLKGDITLIR